MGLLVHRAERADALVGGLAEVLGRVPDDPFTRELVAVPTRGVERWLAQRLAHHLGAGSTAAGVAAGIAFPAPAELVATAVSTVTGLDPGDDPWAPARFVWVLLEVIDTCAPEPWCAPLARHLGLDNPARRRDRRWKAAQHLARLFTAYGQQRPELVGAWARGVDTDGAGADLDDDLGWQAELWRRLRGTVGVPSPAERLPEVCAALRADATPVDLPARFSVFGPTRLTIEQAGVLTALAVHRDVHLWLSHPSAASWEAVAAAVPTRARPRRRQDPSAAVVRHRLLSSLGRDSREMQVVLAEATAGEPVRDQQIDAPAPPGTLLGRIQADLRADRPPLPTHTLDPGADRSLQVHACHGRARQVEVLREVLLGLLRDDPTLEPRDVLVMCPDIETYAPLVSATFGLAAGGPEGAGGPTRHLADPVAHPGHRLRVRLADRSLRQTNPVLDVVSRLLDLADARVSASQVLDLVALPPVRRRFRLDDGAVERLADWVATSGVRWGLDAAHRRPYGLEALTQNTWQSGLDRLLLGVTMSEDDLTWLGLALPLDDVDSGDVALAGRLAELVDRLAGVLDALVGEHPLRHWLDTITGAVESLTRVPEPDAWQVAQARRELHDVAVAAGDRGHGVELTLADVRALLADRLAGRPTRANFRTGTLTMCSMVPMRSVPHRVICLLGLDDGVFPRGAGVDGDDVLGRDPLVGERHRCGEDRQLLLDALLAAQEHLVVIYTGADERSGATRPPAVPLGEILDVVDATVRGERPAREQIVVRHPLQPFDARNFEPDGLGGAGPFSFDPGALAGAVAAAGPRTPQPALLRARLPEPAGRGPAGRGDVPVPMHLLVRFLEHPVRGFLEQRLGVGLPAEEDQLDDTVHAELDRLARWAVGDRWLSDRVAGAEVDTARRAAWLRGDLPPGALGTVLLDAVVDEAEPVLAAGAPHRSGPGETHDVSVPLPNGRILAGTVAGVHGACLSRTVFSRLRPKHRLRDWVHLLALAASLPDTVRRATTVGRGRADADPPAVATLHAPGPEEAAATLAALVDVHDRGLREPLPLPLDTAHAYASVRHLRDDERSAYSSARRRWYRDHGDAQDGWHVRVWGADRPLEVVTGQHPTDHDQPVDHDREPSSRFAALACRLWLPLLDHQSEDGR